MQQLLWIIKIPDGIHDHPQSDINSFNKLFIKSLIIITCHNTKCFFLFPFYHSKYLLELLNVTNLQINLNRAIFSVLLVGDYSGLCHTTSILELYVWTLNLNIQIVTFKQTAVGMTILLVVNMLKSYSFSLYVVCTEKQIVIHVPYYSYKILFHKRMHTKFNHEKFG